MPFDVARGDVGYDYRNEVAEHGPRFGFVAHVGLVERIAIRSHPSRCEVIELIDERSSAVFRNRIDGAEMKPALAKHFAGARPAAGRNGTAR